MPPIALITDFGTNDTYVGQMKGVILGMNPQAMLVDITHAIGPQDVFQGALALDESFDAFPAGTIHLVVVDPGVGSACRRIAVELGNQRFVGPDNGLVSCIARRYPVKRAHELSKPRFHRAVVAPTFHGRDIFAPVAAAWSVGFDVSEFGPAIIGPLQELVIPTIRRDVAAITGEVISIDRFGNLITNITAGDLPQDQCQFKTEINGRQIVDIKRFYAECEPQELIVLWSSQGRLEVALNGGSAAKELKAEFGTRVQVTW